MDKMFFIRKQYEFDSLHRVVEELNRYIDERIRQEEEAADVLPDHSGDPEWKDKKIFYLENVHAFHSIEQHLLRLLIEKQKEMDRLMKAYKHQMKVEG
jgi:hypothetical protein